MRRLAILLLLGFAAKLQAQQIFDAYKQDANTYLTHYAFPLFDGMVLNSADGWIHRAKPLKTLHLALQINTDYATVPARFQNFTYRSSEYEYLQVLDDAGNPLPDGTALPTVLGPDTDYKIKLKSPASVPGTYYELEFPAPPGFKDDLDSLLQGFKPGIPGMSIQLAVGLPLNTEVMLRYFPKINYQNIRPDVLGLGVKHDIGQYLGLKSSFRLSAYAAYTHSSVRVSRDSIDWEARYGLNTFTLGAVGSVELKLVSLYGGLAYIRGGTSLQIIGHKDITYNIVDNNGIVIGQQTETLHNPLDLHFGVNDYKGFVGIRFNLWILHIFAQYNIQKFPGYHAGIGIQI